MQVNEFIFRERLDGPFPVGIQVIEPCYDLQHERIPSLAGNNRINLLCASKSNYKHSSNRPYGICIDGMNYLIRLYNKQTVGIVMSSLLEGKTLEMFKKMSYDKLSYLENYYYFRADWLEEWQIDCVTNTNYATKAKLGVLGRFVEMNAAINRTGVVVSSEKNRIIVQFRDKLGLRRYPVRFTDFRVGDAVVVYRKLAFKVENWAAFQERAMICGQVVSRNGGNLFISVPDNKYGKDYFYHDPANRFKVGDRVRFFPLLNRVNRFRGNPLATLVEPAEDLGKAPGWQGDFRNFQN